MACNKALCLLLVFLLAACSEHHQIDTTMSIEVPASRMNSKRLFTDYEGARVEVSVNGGPKQNFSRQNSSIWVVALEGVTLNRQNDLDIMWYVVVNEVRYDVALQSGTIFADPNGPVSRLTAVHQDQAYDHDNDSVSNLTELREGGFPVSADNVPEVVTIQAPGTFTIGSPGDEPGRYDNEQQSQASIADSFAIGKFEVTYAQFEVFANANVDQNLPPGNGLGGGDLPVTNVNWKEAHAYTEWLSDITGKRFRLPTEAEWEYAARGGVNAAFNTGDYISSDQANLFAQDLPVYYQERDAGGVNLQDGVFRPTAIDELTTDSVWLEYKIDPSSREETFFSEFVERRRDSDGIWLYDAPRDLWVVLSLTADRILFSTDGVNVAPLPSTSVSEDPNPVHRLVRQQPVPVGSFAPNRYGLFDMHGNVFEWTCSQNVAPYGGAAERCVDPGVVDLSTRLLMVKRGGAFSEDVRESRSANRGWNNDGNIGTADTGFRIVMEL